MYMYIYKRNNVITFIIYIIYIYIIYYSNFLIIFFFFFFMIFLPINSKVKSSFFIFKTWNWDNSMSLRENFL